MFRVLSLPADELAAMGKMSRGMVENHSIERTLRSFEEIYRGASYEDLVV
jgi:1,2-diacylglycerol 3-alpha-glucosyltransferase